MDDSVIVWTGSRFDEWDYCKTKELGIPSYAREATPQEASLYRENKAALRSFAEREKELVEALEQIELLHFGDNTFHEDAVKAHLIARAILAKHKEPAPVNPPSKP